MDNINQDLREYIIKYTGNSELVTLLTNIYNIITENGMVEYMQAFDIINDVEEIDKDPNDTIDSLIYLAKEAMYKYVRQYGILLDPDVWYSQSLSFIYNFVITLKSLLDMDLSTALIVSGILSTDDSNRSKLISLLTLLNINLIPNKLEELIIDVYDKFYKILNDITDDVLSSNNEIISDLQTSTGLDLIIEFIECLKYKTNDIPSIVVDMSVNPDMMYSIVNDPKGALKLAINTLKQYNIIEQDNIPEEEIINILRNIGILMLFLNKSDRDEYMSVIKSIVGLGLTTHVMEIVDMVSECKNKLDAIIKFYRVDELEGDKNE